MKRVKVGNKAKFRISWGFDETNLWLVDHVYNYSANKLKIKIKNCLENNHYSTIITKKDETKSVKAYQGLSSILGVQVKQVICIASLVTMV